MRLVAGSNPATRTINHQETKENKWDTTIESRQIMKEPESELLIH